MREIYRQRKNESTLRIVEGKVYSVRQKDITKTGCRIYKDGFMGVAGTLGEATEETWAEAEKNLGLKVSYPFEPEKNQEKSIDYRKEAMETKEFLKQIEEVLAYLNENYNDFSFDGYVFDTETETSMENEEGLKLCSKDRVYSVAFIIKDNNLANIMDLQVEVSGRTFEKEKLIRIAEGYLQAFRNKVEMPTEDLPVIINPFLIGQQLESDLSGERIGTKTSLLAGKEGQKVFSDKVTIYTSIDRDPMFYGQSFFDAEGKFSEEPCVFVENGVFKKPFADKRIAQKYGFEETGSASGEYDDIPSIKSMELLQFKTSDKTLKELLGGKLGILIDIASGGDFTSTGDFASPVQLAYLTDGEKLIGKLPEINISGNIFDILGDGYIGYAKDDELTGSKALVVNMKVTR